MTMSQWLPDRRQWDIEQERDRNLQALYRFGEYCIFYQFWQDADFKAGLVGRCSVCEDIDHIAMATYKQPAQTRCPSCFGTTYEGGWKRRVVRPAVWSEDTQIDQQEVSRGTVEVARAQISVPYDLLLLNGDLVIRADNSRWHVEAVTLTLLHTGFTQSPQPTTAIGYNVPTIVLEPKTSVTYTLPPDDPNEATDMLGDAFVRRPLTFAFDHTKVVVPKFLSDSVAGMTDVATAVVL